MANPNLARNDITLLWLLRNSKTVYHSIVTAAQEDEDGGLVTGKTAKDIMDDAQNLRDLIIAAAEKQGKDKTELERKIEDIESESYYIMYAPVGNPSEEQMTSVPNDTTLFMGLCVSTESEAPTDPTAYVWSRIKGDEGVDGEDATMLYIDSSRGTVFKNNSISTRLTVVIYHGAERITDAQALRQSYGTTAYLQWSWQRMDEDRFGIISADDSRILDDGFTFVLTPADVDTKVTFSCELIID